MRGRTMTRHHSKTASGVIKRIMTPMDKLTKGSCMIINDRNRMPPETGVAKTVKRKEMTDRENHNKGHGKTMTCLNSMYREYNKGTLIMIIDKMIRSKSKMKNKISLWQIRSRREGEAQPT